ncbi:hypothetical protein M6B38_249795 [Iris pallida]|uniref:Uncharacterized protein n=1 Tax=Iris pallida TaxID=29817 RepID=A0AAX6IM81_IRIPA|nr:hypothetical protein M6B38_249795 [Iris pallida]
MCGLEAALRSGTLVCSSWEREAVFRRRAGGGIAAPARWCLVGTRSGAAAARSRVWAAGTTAALGSKAAWPVLGEAPASAISQEATASAQPRGGVVGSLDLGGIHCLPGGEDLDGLQGSVVERRTRGHGGRDGLSEVWCGVCVYCIGGCGRVLVLAACQHGCL